MVRLAAFVLMAMMMGPLMARAASQKTFDQQFEQLARRVDQGVGGYLGTVKPVSGEIKLAYGPAQPNLHQITTWVATRGAVARIRVRAELTRQASAAGLLMGVTTLKDYNIEHLIGADGVTIGHEALPRGTTVIVASDHRGVIPDAVILPPAGGGTIALPQPGTRPFIEAINRFPLPVLVTETAVQDSDIFLPLTFPLGGNAGIELVRGAGPRLRGEIDCKPRRCLLVQVDEETLFKQKGQEIRGSAKGHVVITAGPVNIVGAFLNLRTEILQGGRTEVIRSILINEQIK